MIRQNDLYTQYINTVKEHEIWELFEFLPTYPVFVESGDFLSCMITHIIISHLLWGYTRDSVGSIISISFVLKYTRMLDLRTHNICGIVPTKWITFTKRGNINL